MAASAPDPRVDGALAVTLAAVLCVVAFVTGGGSALGPNTWAQIALTVAGATLAIVCVLRAGAGRGWGSTAVLLFAGLAALTAVSIVWSVQPADSWVESNRTVSYLAVFAGAMALARIAPARWPAIVWAVAIVATVVSGYSLLVKVFPGSLDPGETIGRLRLPFDYWNAVGLMATLGLAPCLWVGSRREGVVIGRALAVPALGLLIVTIMLSLSRGAVVIAVVGLAVWFLLADARLRAALVLAAGIAGGGALSAWALANHSLTYDNVALAARTSAGHELGWALIAMLAVLGAAGLAIAISMDRGSISRAVQRRIGTGLIVLLALIALAGVGAVAASSRGVTGTISHAYNQLTSPDSGGVSNTPGRLLQVGSTRGRYWNQGLTVGEHAWLKGVGANGFATARSRYFPPINDYQSFQHAHSYVIETFADLGVVGVAISLGLLIAWGLAAARSLRAASAEPAPGVRSNAAAADRERGGPMAHASLGERNGLVALLAVATSFGLNSVFDWTWFIPGPALTALVCAGWLAGRAPIRMAARGGPRLRPLAIFAAVMMAAGTLLVAWMMYQPLHSANADAAGLSALTGGDLRGAIADARAAAAEDPVSVDPLFELAAFYRAAGDQRTALGELRKAVTLQPQNAQTWIQEGETLLAVHRPRQALPVLVRAESLDRGSPEVKADLSRATADARAGS